MHYKFHIKSTICKVIRSWKGLINPFDSHPSFELTYSSGRNAYVKSSLNTFFQGFQRNLLRPNSLVPSPLPLHKAGRWKFSKIPVMGGWKFFTRTGGSQEWRWGGGGGGWWFYNGDGKFLKSLYIVGRGVLTPLFYEDPLTYVAFCPTFFLSVVMFLWLNGWSLHIWSTHVSTHVKPWYLSTRRTLMFVLCNKTSGLLRFLT